jgi:hypothetical protein
MRIIIRLFFHLWPKKEKGPDEVFRLGPIGREATNAMISKQKGQPLPEGFRETTPVNLDLLADGLILLGKRTCRVEAIQEIDINPLLVVKGEPIEVDASLVLRSFAKL